jgi:mono/diheme cytochrome c family protein
MQTHIAKIAMFGTALLGACGAGAADDPTVPDRWYTEDQVETGRTLHGGTCAECHGADGSAAADWGPPGPDGGYPPPPLNGTAQTRHHPLEQLDDTIANGGARFGGVMPGFGRDLEHAERSWPMSGAGGRWRFMPNGQK